MQRDRVFRIGGVISGGVLILFGIAVIVLSAWGRHTVTTELERQKITGTPDMTPSAIKESASAAGLKDVTLPNCDVAGKAITNGVRARCFAQYMNVHALEATGGYVYAEMGRYTAKADAPKSELTPDGATNNPQYAETDPKTQQPVDNPARNVWVTETALATALNVSYMASQISLFGIVVGIALLLTGVGFIILAFAALPRSASPAVQEAPAPAQ